MENKNYNIIMRGNCLLDVIFNDGNIHTTIFRYSYRARKIQIKSWSSSFLFFKVQTLYYSNLSHGTTTTSLPTETVVNESFGILYVVLVLFSVS